MPLEEEEHDHNGVPASCSPTPGENVNDREALPAVPITTSTPSVLARTPPSDRSSPLIRPVRPPPTFGCALPPPSNDLDPLRELQSSIGARPATMDAHRHRQTLDRDLRLDPQMYNWLEFGVMPGLGHLLSPLRSAVLISLIIKTRAWVSRDLATMALDQITTGKLVCQRIICYP